MDGSLPGPEISEAPWELKALIVEASRALAQLDLDRLEVLALTCQALNGETAQDDAKRLACQSKDALQDMAIFARVLDATRANLGVMNRLRELRGNRLEYAGRQVRCGAQLESGHGID